MKRREQGERRRKSRNSERKRRGKKISSNAGKIELRLVLRRK